MSSRGQTLIELVVVVAISAIVIGALVFATISSIRNAQFSKNQALATKLAQEGLEKVRSIRDRNGPASYTGNPGAFDFNGLYQNSLTCPTNCYFIFNSLGVLLGVTAADYENIAPYFKRQFQIEDDVNGTIGKKVTAQVKWSDFSGDHQSKLTTILRKI